MFKYLYIFYNLAILNHVKYLIWSTLIVLASLIQFTFAPRFIEKENISFGFWPNFNILIYISNSISNRLVADYVRSWIEWFR